MVITPELGCTWTYKDGKLSINLTSDEGKSYLFKTHYNVDQLYVRPEINAPFCVEDANLLGDYLGGLGEVVKDEGSALDLGLNGVACQRFTKPTFDTSKYFVAYANNDYVPQLGDVVTLYAVSNEAGDCLVLDPCDKDGLARLMLLNQDFVIDKNRGYLLGMMIRVKPELVCMFRSGIQRNRYSYA